jgi:tetratricopeptide (TPR) repeat protein
LGGRGLVHIGIVAVAFCLGTPFFAAGASNSQSTILSIQALIARGDLVAARSELSQALAADPQNGGLYNLLGIVEIRRGDAKQAQAAFSKAVALDPGLLGAWLNLGRLYQSRLDADPALLHKAIDAYRSALKLDHHSDEAHYQLGMLLEWSGSFDESLANLDALSQPEQRKAPALALRCADLAALGRTAEAQRAARELTIAKDFSEAAVQAALPVLKAKKQDKLTCTLIEALVRRQMASSETLSDLGAAYERLGQFAQARETFDRVARAEPTQSRPLLDLARIAYKQHDRKGALGYLAHARDLDPNNPTIHFVFAIISLELKLPLEADSSMKKALALAPDRPDFNYAMGIVSLYGHDTSVAVPYFEKFIKLSNGDPRGHYGLGIAYFYMGAYEKAKQEMLQVTGPKATGSGAYYFLGRLAKLDGNLADAESEFRKSLTRDSSYADAHAELAGVLMSLHQYPEAKRELDRALELDRANFVANTNLLIYFRRTKDARAVEQSQKLHVLEKKRDQSQELLYRRIEVRPY